jgi:hypothetical protein
VVPKIKYGNPVVYKIGEINQYNKLAGEEKCYVDDDIWSPLNDA